ncbi:hypothetical protein SARC_16269, partial [Sphaeroforma arctica JP610]
MSETTPNDTPPVSETTGNTKTMLSDSEMLELTKTESSANPLPTVNVGGTPFQ